MKRIFILIVISLFTVGALIAEEAILIDFSKLKADLYVDPGAPQSGDADQGGEQESNQNRQTMMDFSTVAGSSYTTQQKSVMKTSLAIENWSVRLTSSSQSVTNNVLTFAKQAPSKQWDTVLGVRVHFPLENWNGTARIAPPFEVPAYDWDTVGDDGAVSRPGDEDRSQPSRFEDGYGVVKNVGTIKAIAVNVYGLNFPHALSAILIDHLGNEKIVHMGYLNFDGWGELTWYNPGYVQEVRNRELRIYPLYPAATPFVKFAGFLVQRDGAADGGDFITYFKDVKIIYDKAVLDTERDIDDEALWRIIETREDAKKRFEVDRFGHDQVLRYLEVQKQATENTFTPTSTGEEETQ
jgi:hypothetical protein